jgi:DNA-binding response OmpR family regulator
MSALIYTEKGSFVVSDDAFKLYETLREEPLRVFAKEELRRALGDESGSVGIALVDVAAWNLRQGFAQVGIERVASIWGIGYRLEVNACGR